MSGSGRDGGLNSNDSTVQEGFELGGVQTGHIEMPSQASVLFLPPQIHSGSCCSNSILVFCGLKYINHTSLARQISHAHK